MKLYFSLVGLFWVLGLFSYPNSFQSSSSLDSDEEFTLVIAQRQALPDHGFKAPP